MDGPGSVERSPDLPRGHREPCIDSISYSLARSLHLLRRFASLLANAAHGLAERAGDGVSLQAGGRGGAQEAESPAVFGCMPAGLLGRKTLCP
jgi:hypothetical protein